MVNQVGLAIGGERRSAIGFANKATVPIGRIRDKIIDSRMEATIESVAMWQVKLWEDGKLVALFITALSGAVLLHLSISTSPPPCHFLLR